MHVSSGQVVLTNISYLVADEDVSYEEIVIGFPVLCSLQVYTKTLLENNRAVLNVSDLSHIGLPIVCTSDGVVKRMMTARINKLYNISEEADTKPMYLRLSKGHRNLISTERIPK